jgi:hypothetical protein
MRVSGGAFQTGGRSAETSASLGREHSVEPLTSKPFGRLKSLPLLPSPTSVGYAPTETHTTIGRFPGRTCPGKTGSSALDSKAMAVNAVRE